MVESQQEVDEQVSDFIDTSANSAVSSFCETIQHKLRYVVVAPHSSE